MRQGTIVELREKCVRRVFFAFALSFAVLCVQVVGAEELAVHEIIALCQQTAFASKKTMETIRTWQGVANVEVLAFAPQDFTGSPERYVKAEIEFFVDKVEDKRCFMVTTQENRSREGDRYVSHKCDILGVLIIDDVVYHHTRKNLDVSDTLEAFDSSVPGSTLESLISDRAVSSGNLIIRQRDEEESRSEADSLLENFDPFVWLHPRAFPTDRRFLEFANLVEANPERFQEKMTFEKKGDMFIATNIPAEQFSSVRVTFVVDTTKEFSVVSRHSEDVKSGVLVRSWVADFEEKNGLFLPQFVEEMLGSGKYVTKIKFSRSVINAPIPEKVFTLEQLGVRQEDRMYDHRTQTEGTVVDPKLPAALYKMQLERSQSHRTLQRHVLTTIGVLLFLIVLTRMYFRWQAKRPGGGG